MKWAVGDTFFLLASLILVIIVRGRLIVECLRQILPHYL